MATKTKKASTAEGNGHAINRITGMLPAPKPSKASKTSGIIDIPVMQLGVCRIEVVGTSPLLVHRFSEKARRQMEAKQQKEATTAKEKRDPQAEFFSSMYIISGDPKTDKPDAPSSKCKAVHGVPAAGFKNAMIRAAKAAGAVMTDCRGAFFVRGDGKCDQQDMVKVDFDKVERHDGVVVLQGSTKDLRYRAQYQGWRTTLEIEYSTSQIGISQLVNLLRVAGFGVGVCEWRPECSGSSGRFSTGRVEDLGTHVM